MNKTLSILCALLILALCVSMAGCGSKGDIPADSPYIGTWKAVRATVKVEVMDGNEVLEKDFIIILNQDGSASVDYDESGKGTWSLTDSGARIKGDDLNIKLKMEDGTMTTSVLGMTFFFEKQ